MKRSSVFLALCSVLLMAVYAGYAASNAALTDASNNHPLSDCDENDPSSSCACKKPDQQSSGSSQASIDCAWITASTGPMRPGTSIGPGFFQLKVEQPTPETVTPAALRYILGYNIFRTSKEETSAGLPRSITVVNKTGITIAFRFDNGESMGVPYVGAQKQLDHRLLMVDAEGWATSTDPAYYDLYPGDGEVYRFVAAPSSPDYLQLAFYRSKTGREETLASVDTEIVRDENEYIRQVLAPSCLADVVVSNQYNYSIIFYFRGDVQSEKDSNGFYVTAAGAKPIGVLTIENPAPTSVNRLRVSNVMGSRTNVSDYVYSPASEQWELSQGDGMRQESIDKSWNDSKTTYIRDRIVKDSSGQIVSRNSNKFNLINGAFRLVQEVNDPNGVADTTTYTRFTSSSDGKKQGRIHSEQHSDGSWRIFDYDANGYKIEEIRGWKDSALGSTVNRAVYYSYTPVDANDNPVYNDQRPRTVTRKINGNVVGKTYYSYVTNSLRELTEIEEKCVTPSGSYGDAGNLRTIKRYYGTNVTGQMIGRLKSIEKPNGTLDTYTYEYGNYTSSTNAAAASFTADPDGLAWRQTITHGTATSPSGIQNKTTRNVSVWDEYGRAVMTEVYLYNGTDYDRVSWTVNTVDNLNHLTKTEKSDGTVFSQSWGSNCCGVESKTDASGIEKVFAYNLLKQRISETKKGATTNDTDLTQSYVLDVTGRRIQTTVSGGGLSQVISSNTYNTAGQLLQSVDSLGLATTYSQTGYGRTNTVIRPGGITNITVSYVDGRTKYTSQNGEIKNYYDYGVNSDGSQWTKVYSGPDGSSSVAWSKTTTDMLGRTIKTERPGFGGTVLTNTYVYNVKGQLLKTTAPGSADTLYEYNDLGQVTRSGLDINDNGILDLAGPDRISESDSSYQSDPSDDWWLVRTSKLYAEESGSAVTTNSIQQARLTGLSASKTSESRSIDILGNQVTSTTAIDRDNKTVTQTVDYPDSTNDAVSVTVNGLLTSSTTKTGLEYTYIYDGLERRAGVTDPRTGTSLTHYNSLGQIDYVEDAASNRTSYAYSATTGRRIAVTNALGKVTRYEYSPEGQLEKTWGDTVYPVSYQYDNFNRMTAMKTYRNGIGWNGTTWPTNTGTADTTTWSYDLATGLLTNKSYASEGSDVSYSYTPDGKLSTRTWARGITTTYSYTNTTGKMIGIDYSDSTPDINFTYNRIGRQKTVVDAQGTRTFAYNQHMALTNETIVANGVTNILSRSQDNLGRSTGFDLASGGTAASLSVSYAFDNQGRFSSVQSALNGTTNTFAYNYLPDSDLIESMVSGSITNSKSYEPSRNLITKVKNMFGATTISKYQYSNDALGRRTQRIDTLSSVTTNTFGYNDRSEVIDAILGTDDYSYDFDSIGNRKTSSLNSETNSYTANQLNQYSDVNGTNQTFDADGNTLTSGGWTYSWNGENRMATASNGSMVVSFKYDYMGRRFSKTVDSAETLFIYDGWNLVRETSDTVTNHYTWGLDLSQSLQGAGGIGGLLSVTESDGSVYFPSIDANGNITAYIDDTGAVKAVYEYSPFGKVIASSGSKADDFKFRFSTKYQDETGLLYYGYRYYNPELGRWPNRDPLGEDIGGKNLFAFVLNDPMRKVDPVGLVQGWNWGVADFIAWYWAGFGNAVDLSNWRYLSDFKDRIHNSRDNMKEDIEDALPDIDCKGKASTFFEYSGVINGGFQVSDGAGEPLDALTDVQRVLNAGGLRMEYDCRGEAECDCCDGGYSAKSVDVGCRITVTMTDRFANPWDRNGPHYERDVKAYKRCRKDCKKYHSLTARWACEKRCKQQYPPSEEWLASPYDISATWIEDHNFTKDLDGCGGH